MSWDYLIIGAGSAGCAVGFGLAHADPTVRVLIVEAGGSDRSPFIRVPAGQLRAIATRDWGYQSQPDPSRNGLSEGWARGRVLGGSSSINGTMYVRGARRDFDRWADLSGARDGAGWAARDMLALYRDMECSDQGQADRGHCGPLYVRTVRHPHVTTRAFVESASVSGHSFNPDYNGDSQAGVGYAQLSQRRGLRCSAADAFLKPLRGRSNVRVSLHTQVLNLEIDRGRVSGVRLRRAGRSRMERANNIVLCAGALNTPQLLMLSGIGDPEELRRHGIDVAIDLPGVGRNLQEHPLINLTYRATQETYNLTGGMRQKLAIGMQFLRTREGPLSNLFEGVAFLKSAATETAPDIQLHFMPIGCLPGSDGSMEIATFPSVTVLLNKSYPKSRGRVRLGSAAPEDPPRIECRLLDDPSDISTLIKGIGVVREIMRTAPVSNFLSEEVTPGHAVNAQDTLEAYVRSHTGLSYHPAGTCRMGVDRGSVVGSDLRVHGTENLWIADASVMPDLPSGNTNAACMAIGLKLGRQLSARDGKPGRS